MVRDLFCYLELFTNNSDHSTSFSVSGEFDFLFVL